MRMYSVIDALYFNYHKGITDFSELRVALNTPNSIGRSAVDLNFFFKYMIMNDYHRCDYLFINNR